MFGFDSAFSTVGEALLGAIVAFFVTLALSAVFTDKVRPGTAILMALVSAVILGLFFPSTHAPDRVSEEDGHIAAAVESEQSLEQNSGTTTAVTDNPPNKPPSPPTTPVQVMSSQTSLFTLNYVAVDTNLDIDLDMYDSISVNAETAGPALTYSCSVFCNGSSPQIRQFVLGGKFSRLQGRLFVLDSSADVHHVEFYDGDVLLQGYNVSPGAPTPVDLDVSGISRFSVVLYSPSPLKSPLQAGVDTTVGNNGGGLPGVAFVEPLLLP